MKQSIKHIKIILCKVTGDKSDIVASKDSHSHLPSLLVSLVLIPMSQKFKSAMWVRLF